MLLFAIITMIVINTIIIRNAKFTAGSQQMSAD